MKNVVHVLNDQLLQQAFEEAEAPEMPLSHCRLVAQMYATTENAISVLSDLKTNKSYIYYGGIAPVLGLGKAGHHKVIHSIWEKDIFDKILPDHLLEKHALELTFFHLLKDLPAAERRDFQIVSRMRMQNATDLYITIEHRMFYIGSSGHGPIRLALCLYHFPRAAADDNAYHGSIINTRTGEVVNPHPSTIGNILSQREKDVLRLIKQGKPSKEIAGLLSISVYTVNRHRQNILHKLQVTNSMEACRIAESMKLL